jgi:protein ImuB
LRQPAERFVAGLAAEGLVCTTVQIQVVTEHGSGVERGWLHPRWFDAADIIDRLRWQLQGDGRSETGLTSRVVRVGLVPEDVDPVGAHADALWGGGPDEHVHRALTRVQSILGHGAVVSAVVGGGRSPAERQTLVPWGDRPVPRRTPDEPWVGNIPAPAPSTVYPEPRPAVVLTEDRQPLTVDDRCVLNGAPGHFQVEPSPRERGRLQPVDGWAGPWPVSERWWDAEESRRTTRFQVVGADGTAYLLRVDDDGRWWAEARYD